MKRAQTLNIIDNRKHTHKSTCLIVTIPLLSIIFTFFSEIWNFKSFKPLAYATDIYPAAG